MSPTVAFARKEASEFVRSWRGWVLFGALALFAVTGPITARYMAQILGAALGSSAANALPIPEATYVDAYQQWTKNLGDAVSMLLIIATAGVVAGECRSGTAVLMLTKPLSRRAFVLTKLAVSWALLAAGVLTGTALTWGVARLFFPGAPPGPLLRAVAAWLLLAAFLLTVVVAASAALSSTGAAAGVGFATYLLLAAASAWEPLRDATPAGLARLPAQLAAGQAHEAGGSLATTLLLVAVLAWGAVLAFQRREL